MANKITHLLFVDTETTGLDPETCSITEIAAIVLDVSDPLFPKPTQRFHRYVWPDTDVSDEIKALNGYDGDKWAQNGAASPGDALAGMVPMMLGATWVGQNPHFDIGFVKAAWKKWCRGVEFPKMDYRTIDVTAMAWPLYQVGLIDGLGQKSTSKLFGLGSQKHTAIEDVEACVEIFLKMCKLYGAATATLETDENGVLRA